jgi:hypothetical protein
MSGSIYAALVMGDITQPISKYQKPCSADGGGGGDDVDFRKAMLSPSPKRRETPDGADKRFIPTHKTCVREVILLT